MAELTFFDVLLALVTFPIQLIDFLTTKFLEFIFFDLLNLGTGAMM